MWAAKDKKQPDSLFVYECPAGYCRCGLSTQSGDAECVHSFKGDEPDDQCACGRKGAIV